jgi:uncharacterized membrane protein YdjX (TVP38/TMEM64 family)
MDRRKNRSIRINKDWFTRKNLLNLGLLLAFLTSIVLIAIFFDLDSIKGFIRTHEKQAILVSIVVYGFFGITFLPTFPLTVFIAVLLGPLPSALIATVGNTLAAVLGYLLGKTMGDVFDFEKRKSKLPFGLGRLPIKSPLFMLAARSLPAGSRAYSVVCGAYQVPLSTYLWTTSLMFFLNSTFLAFGGLQLVNLF